MAKIVKVDPQTVTVEMNSGKQKTYPIGAVEFDNPEVGDEVKLYKHEDGSVSIDLPDEETAPKKATVKPVKTQGGKKEGKSGLGIAGFVIGIIAIIFSFIPIVNNIAFFIGIIAAIFGIIGAITHKSKGLSIAGAILGVLAVVITLALQSMWSKALDNASEQLNEVMESADSQMSNITGENTEEILQKSVNVELGTYSASKDEYGFVTSSLPVTVTNKESEAKSFSFHVEAVDGSGSRIMDDYIYANDLGAGQSQSFELFQFVTDEKYDAMQSASFNIIEASMY
jgi:hypothetical protein